jgi:methionine sulfoxide reductase heme-binding subunit
VANAAKPTDRASTAFFQAMKRSTIILLKVLTWIACLWPFGLLVYGAVTNTLGADPTSNIELTTGYNTLLLLILSLAITPLRRVWSGLSWLIQFRRLLGLFAFFYGTVHLLAYVALYAGFDVHAMLTDIARRKFITIGFAAWLLLVPLAATSTTGSIRRLGGKNWNRLHMLVYLAVVCGIIHYWWQVKTGVLSPLRLTIVLSVLLLARPALWWLKKRKARSAVTV